MSPTTCSTCGAPWRAGARFCPSCGAVEAAAPSSDSPTAPSPPGGSGAQRWVVVGGIIALVAVVGVLAGVVLGGEAASQKFSSVGSVIDPTGFDAGTSDGGSASVDTTSSSSSTSTSTTSTTTVSSRSGSLFSNEAILRSSPNLGATEIRRFVDRNGMGLTVIGSIDQSGWYQVSIDGTEGYLFGAFVTPPEPGYCVAESRGTEPDIIDSSGFVVVPAGGNPSGSKVLVTTENPGGSSWPVVLADGRTGFVRASDMKSPLC